MINWVKNMFRHKHYFNKPLVSMYWTFHTRKIVYECSCRLRKTYSVSCDFSEPFPIPTDTFISYSDLDLIENGADFEKLGTLIIVNKE